MSSSLLYVASEAAAARAPPDSLLLSLRQLQRSASLNTFWLCRHVREFVLYLHGMNRENPKKQAVFPFAHGSSRRGQDSADFRYDVSLLGVAGSGGDDAVRLEGCEGSVSLAWRTGEG